MTGKHRYDRSDIQMIHPPWYSDTLSDANKIVWATWRQTVFRKPHTISTTPSLTRQISILSPVLALLPSLIRTDTVIVIFQGVVTYMILQLHFNSSLTCLYYSHIGFHTIFIWTDHFWHFITRHPFSDAVKSRSSAGTSSCTKLGRVGNAWRWSCVTIILLLPQKFKCEIDQNDQKWCVLCQRSKTLLYSIVLHLLLQVT